MAKSLADLQRVLDQLNATFPRPGLTLQASAPYSTATQWKECFPDSANPGVYAYFDSSGKLLYIGKASCGNTLGARMGAYFRTEAGRPIVVDPRFPPDLNLTIVTIAVPTNRAFEAAAVEEYLIQELQPPINTIGRRQ